MDVFEHLVLIMIIRREIINFSIKHKRNELLNIESEILLDQLEHQDENIALGYFPNLGRNVGNVLNNQYILEEEQSTLLQSPDLESP